MHQPLQIRLGMGHFQIEAFVHHNQFKADICPGYSGALIQLKNVNFAYARQQTRLAGTR